MNTIPDTTLYVGDEPYYRDLFAEPVVLRHTGGGAITILVLETGDPDAVLATSARSNITGALNAIEVTALNEGISTIVIQAKGPCDFILETRFQVNVDTTHN